MIKQKLKPLFYCFVLLIVLSSCSTNKDNITIKENPKNIENKTSIYISSLEGNEDYVVKTFGTITKTGNLVELNKNIKNENFEEIQKNVKEILKGIKTENKENSEPQKIQALKFIQVGAILNEGNYYYKEKEKSKEALEIIQEINKEDPDYIDPFYSNYYLGYAKEITKDYSGALNNYDIALKSAPDIEKNKKLRAVILNQIGHLYDLKGDLEKAYSYYQDSYKLDQKNYSTSSNIARYLYRIGRYDEAKKFYEYSIYTPNKALRAEVFFSLSSIELELNGVKPDINKSIEYAKLAIETYKEYPMGYLALGRGYYMLNDKKYYGIIDENLKKSMELNPNGFEAYKYYGLFEYDKGNLDGAKNYINMSSKKADNDMILMDNQRESIKEVNKILILFLEASYNDKNSFYDFIKSKDFNIFTHFQLKRNNYGIYSFLKDEEKFKRALKLIK